MLLTKFLLKKTLVVVLVIFVVWNEARQAKDTSRLPVKHRLEEQLFAGYKTEKTPCEDLADKQVNVNISIQILAISSVDVMNMEYTVDMYLRQSWYDPRLSWKHLQNFSDAPDRISIPHRQGKMWLPDLFFRNGKKGSMYKMTIPNFLIRVTSDGKIIYSQKITMQFSCQMHLSNFPMDKQTCLMDIGSYGYTIEYLKFHWNLTNPVNADPDIEISEFKRPSNFTTFDCTDKSSQTTGSYSCLAFSFRLERQIGSYLVGVYIPTILVVMVSWLSFWVSMEAIPARVTIGLLTLLSIVTKGADVAGNLPRVSYIKAIDIWMISCILFVICSLIEFAVACQRMRKIQYSNWETEVRTLVRQELARTMCPCPSPGLASSGGYMLPPVNGKQSRQRSLLANNGYSHDFCNGSGLGLGHCHTLLYENHHINKSVGFKIPLKVYSPEVGEETVNGSKMIAMDERRSRNSSSKDPNLRSSSMKRPLNRKDDPRPPTSRRSNSESKPPAKQKTSDYRSLRKTNELKNNTAMIRTKPSSFSFINNSFNAQQPTKNPKKISNANEIDSHSRIIFPTIFLLYNCAYWCYYIILAHNE